MTKRSTATLANTTKSPKRWVKTGENEWLIPFDPLIFSQPLVASECLALPDEGLYDAGGDTPQPATSADNEGCLRKTVEHWLSNLPLVLDQIEWYATKISEENPQKDRPIPNFHLREAQRVLFLVNQLRGVKSKRRQRDIAEGCLLGRHVERMGALIQEKQIVKANKQAQRARAAGKLREKLSPEQRRRVKCEIDGLLVNGDADSRKAACKLLAKKYSVSCRTLERCDGQ